MTVLSRVVRATPYRPADEAWEVIVGLLAPNPGAARDEMMKVAGVATSLIAAEAPKDDKIVVWGGGPRVRISCIYDEDAITGDNANETKLARSATDGDWSMNLPCREEDLAWVTAALAKKSKRITARKLGEKLDTDADEDGSVTAANIDKEAFLRP
jgi:hypothetical protein